MSTTYSATIRHHSIACAPRIEVTGTLTDAKRAATRRFGGGFVDHEIIITDEQAWPPEIVSTRRIGDTRWQDRQY